MKGTSELRLEAPAEHGNRPIVVVADLDGAVLKTSLLLESLLALLKQKPYLLFYLPVWLLRGKACFKEQVARRTPLDVKALPYREELLDYLQARRTQGRSLALTTGSEIQIAQKVADHLRIFDFTLPLLSGDMKRKRLISEFGEQGFEYAPDVFKDPPKGLGEYLKPLRPQHWLKNLLVFVPLLTAHRDGITSIDNAVLAFLAFACLSSTAYVINDLFDLAADRHHPQKSSRPFASGRLPLSYGAVVIPVLFFLGALLGMLVSPSFLAVLSVYFILTTAYSLYLKQVVVLDVILLANLYTMRILGGSAAVGIWPSHWLLAFSTFLFLSLALVKRYGELVIMRTIDGDHARARAYEISDGELLASMGIASGYLSVLVLALYINSDAARALYGSYELIWFLCPLLLYWISHLWLIAHRGMMPDDPVGFAIRDRISRILILLIVATTVLAL